MTRFAPSSVYMCPGCKAFFLRPRFYSINTYGIARDWSDGAPFALWRHEPLVRCDACAALFWLDDIEPVGIMPEKPRPIGRLARRWIAWCGDPDGRLRKEAKWAETCEAWNRARTIGSVGFDDVVYVLSRSKGMSWDRVLWLRNRIWWTLNDHYRRESDGSLPAETPLWPVASEQANMEAILAILRDAEVQPRRLVQQGELLRLLGRFDEAIGVLKTVPADGYNEVRAVKIERLARNGDMQVRELSLLSR